MLSCYLQYSGRIAHSSLRIVNKSGRHCYVHCYMPIVSCVSRQIKITWDTSAWPLLNLRELLLFVTTWAREVIGGETEVDNPVIVSECVGWWWREICVCKRVYHHCLVLSAQSTTKYYIRAENKLQSLSQLFSPQVTENQHNTLHITQNTSASFTLGKTEIYPQFRNANPGK